MTSRTIWCIGLYASASTWAFNAVRLIHEATRIPARTYFFSGPSNLAPLDQPVTHIVKSHEISDPATVNELGRRASKIIITVRDPRDAVASLLRYHNHNFESALNHVDQTLRLCVRFAPDPRAKLYYYEQKFFENPATPANIATHLGLNPAPAACAQIFEALKRENVEKHIARMPTLPGILQDRISGDRLDPQTHWHTHHAGRTGNIGGWRNHLEAAQAQAIAARLRDVFRFHDGSG
jgi:hypothetical protein